MSSLLLVVLLAVIVFLWSRRARVSRQRWLTRLSLPGTWVWQAEGTQEVIELKGALAAGEYVARDESGATERGDWHLSGGTLAFTSDRGAERRYVFRQFGDGSIGLDGPGRERRIYRRERSNVVPLARIRRQ